MDRRSSSGQALVEMIIFTILVLATFQLLVFSQLEATKQGKKYQFTRSINSTQGSSE